jgi:hypothetical protein
MGIQATVAAFSSLLAAAQQAHVAVAEEMHAGVTFSETIAHLGGLRALGGAVLLLALAYLALVEWLLPRGRRMHQFKAAPRRPVNAVHKRE